MLISAVTYYYFGEEIKVYSISLWNWLRGRNPGDGGNNPPNTQDRYNSWVNLIGLNKNNAKNLNITDILDDDIGLVDTENPIASTSKAKEVLTSPSLDNLNSTAQDSWSNSRPNSPQSATSSGTVTQGNINNSSNNLFKHDEIPKSMINSSFEGDDAFYSDKSVKPFMLRTATKFISQEDWRLYVNKGISNRMEFIENTFNSENELDFETGNKMVDEMAVITTSYDKLTEAYELSKTQVSDRKLRTIKTMAFHMRGWIKDYSSKLLPNHEINITKGLTIDSPKPISKDIFGDDD